jgi:hypothetical protein
LAHRFNQWIRSRLSGKDSVLVADSYFGIGSTAFAQKDFAKSRKYLNDALSIARKASDKRREARYQKNLGLKLMAGEGQKLIEFPGK